MALSRATIERQVKDATKALEAHVALLESRSIDASQFRRDPTYRKLRARVKKCEARLKAVANMETLAATLSGGA